MAMPSRFRNNRPNSASFHTRISLTAFISSGAIVVPSLRPTGCQGFSTGWSIAEPAWVSGILAERDAKTALGMRDLPTGPNGKPRPPLPVRRGRRYNKCSSDDYARITTDRRRAAGRPRPCRSGVEHHGQEDRLTGHESSRQALEHSNHAYLQTRSEHRGNPTGHGGHDIKEGHIAALAYRLWRERGCPQGSPQQDWLRAVEELRSGH